MNRSEAADDLVYRGGYALEAAYSRKGARRSELRNSFAQLHGDNRCVPYLVERNAGPAATNFRARRGGRPISGRVAPRF